VALIRKNRPEWQAGLLNGIGGKVNDGEGWNDAMTREFFEETDVVIKDWKDYCELIGPDFQVLVYKAEGEMELTSKTDEHVQWYRLSYLSEENMIENLTWLIPMALSKEYASAVVNYYHENGKNSGDPKKV
jgi:8-oxo-dGTP diphosphatase